MSEIIVYSMSNCTSCNLLKEFLHEMDVYYEEKDFDTADSRIDLIMCNCFGVEEAPVLRVEEVCYTSGQLFKDGRLDINLVAKALGGVY